MLDLFYYLRAKIVYKYAFHTSWSNCSYILETFYRSLNFLFPTGNGIAYLGMQLYFTWEKHLSNTVLENVIEEGTETCKSRNCMSVVKRQKNSS